MGPDNQAALGAVAATHTTNFVNFLRGDRSKEGDGQPFRERESALGDFVNSTPVLVKDAVNLGYINLPAGQGGGAPYSTFLTQKAARPAVLFVGGNDGMLHAFKDTRGVDVDADGREILPTFLVRSTQTSTSWRTKTTALRRSITSTSSTAR